MADSTMSSRGILVGVRDVVFCKMTADTTTTTYETDKFFAPGVIEIGLTAQSTDDTVGADDNPLYEVFKSIDGYEVSLTLAALAEDGATYLLGQTADTKGVVFEASNNTAPYVAMGFKTARSDGSDDYVWLYKGKFVPSDATYHTKEQGTVNWQNAVLKGTFTPRNSDKRIKAVVNTANTSASTILNTFFSAPYETPV